MKFDGRVQRYESPGRTVVELRHVSICSYIHNIAYQSQFDWNVSPGNLICLGPNRTGDNSSRHDRSDVKRL